MATNEIEILKQQNAELLGALRKIGDAVQRFKGDWYKVPYFADRVNKATREAISAALSPIVNLDAVGGPLDLSRTPAADAAAQDRKAVLLKAAYDLLRKQDQSHYVLNILATTAHWDDAECDGFCLMEEIADELGLGVN